MGWNKVIVSGSEAHLLDVTASAVSPLFFPNITTNASLRALVVDSTGNVFKASGDFGSSTLALNQHNVYIGNSANVAQGVPLTGDATIASGSSTAIFTLSGSSIGNKTELVTPAGTEFALVLDGTTLRKTLLSNFGNRTGSFTGSFTGSIRTPLSSANIFVGDASNIATAVAMTGDISISNTGNTTISTILVNSQITAESGRLDVANTKFFISSGSNNLNRKITYQTLLDNLTSSLSNTIRTGSFTGSFTGSIRQTLTNNNFLVGNGSNIASETTLGAGDVIWSGTSLVINGRKITEDYLHADIINTFTTVAVTPYAGMVFAVGGDGTNRKLTYNQLTSSLSSSFSGLGFSPSANTVTNAGTSTDNAIARFDASTGKIIQNSSVIIDDSNNITGVNNLTVNGDLNVNGTLTNINTTNLQVEDRFILLASGSTAAGDAGLIFQQSATQGLMFGYDNSANSGGTFGQLALELRLNGDNAFTTPTIFVPTVQTGGSSPSALPAYGGTLAKGAIYVETGGDIWIYS